MNQSRASSAKKPCGIAFLWVLMVSVTACSVSAPRVAESDEPSSNGAEWTENDIEYKLAVVDAGGFVSTDDPVIDSYATALDNAESVCPEHRTMLSDIAVRSVQLLDENVPGHTENALSMLRAIHDAASGGEQLGVECTEIAATIIVLIQEG